MTKDNKLDQESSSLHCRTICSYDTRGIEIDDQLWYAGERDCSNRKSEYPQNLHMNKKVNILLQSWWFEKESSVDMLEMPNRALATQQEWPKESSKGFKLTCRSS